tara:strand:- start:217 stop:435 length:219 start_codon:yes stop_codon:yes gene_type:complete
MNNITENEEITIAKLLVSEQIAKDKKRRDYMRKYYEDRKKQGFIKSKKNANAKKNCLNNLKIERGLFIVKFD